MATESESTEVELCVVVVGNPIDGVSLHGPFADVCVANEYADLAHRNDEWWVAGIHKPEAGLPQWVHDAVPPSLQGPRQPIPRELWWESVVAAIVGPHDKLVEWLRDHGQTAIHTRWLQAGNRMAVLYQEVLRWARDNGPPASAPIPDTPDARLEHAWATGRSSFVDNVLTVGRYYQEGEDILAEALGYPLRTGSYDAMDRDTGDKTMLDLCREAAERIKGQKGPENGT